MSEFLVTFAYAERGPGSRDYVVGVDLQKDSEHVALLMATIAGDQVGKRQGRDAKSRDGALRAVAQAIGAWAQIQVEAGRLDGLRTADRCVVVPPAELAVTVGDEDADIILSDGHEIARFEA